MKKGILFALLLMGTVACNAAPKLVYNGDTLEWNYSWKKTQCGTLDIKANIIEVSGIAWSRVTPGYIWMQSDETVKYIIATDEKGEKRACKVYFTKSIRWDRHQQDHQHWQGWLQHTGQLSPKSWLLLKHRLERLQTRQPEP